jgi:hypothetical protein
MRPLHENTLLVPACSLRTRDYGLTRCPATDGVRGDAFRSGLFTFRVFYIAVAFRRAGGVSEDGVRFVFSHPFDEERRKDGTREIGGGARDLR